MTKILAYPRDGHEYLADGREYLLDGREIPVAHPLIFVIGV